MGASRTGAGRQKGKMVNKCAAIVYIRLNASMNKQKKKHPITSQSKKCAFTALQLCRHSLDRLNARVVPQV